METVTPAVRKMRAIVRIQALFRGFKARRRMRALRGIRSNGRGAIEAFDSKGEYNRKLTEQIAARLGPFKFESHGYDGIRRETKEQKLLENGAIYTGEWSVTSNERDGRGL